MDKADADILLLEASSCSDRVQTKPRSNHIWKVQIQSAPTSSGIQCYSNQIRHVVASICLSEAKSTLSPASRLQCSHRLQALINLYHFAALKGWWYPDYCRGLLISLLHTWTNYRDASIKYCNQIHTSSNKIHTYGNKIHRLSNKIDDPALLEEYIWRKSANVSSRYVVTVFLSLS